LSPSKIIRSLDRDRAVAIPDDHVSLRVWLHHHKLPDRAWGIWDNTFATLRVQVNADGSAAWHTLC